MMTEKDAAYYNLFYKNSEVYNNPDYTINPYYEMWNSVSGLLSDEERIVDLGCGAGQLAKMLFDNNKKYVYGCDFSWIAINTARDNNKSNDVFHIKSLYDSNLFKDIPEYDTILLLEVLEHLDNDIDVLNNIPSGKRIIFSVPNFWYESHVRIFNDFDSIIERYSDILKITNHCGLDVGFSNIIFLCDAIKK